MNSTDKPRPKTNCEVQKLPAIVKSEDESMASCGDSDSAIKIQSNIERRSKEETYKHFNQSIIESEDGLEDDEDRDGDEDNSVATMSVATAVVVSKTCGCTTEVLGKHTEKPAADNIGRGRKTAADRW